MPVRRQVSTANARPRDESVPAPRFAVVSHYVPPSRYGQPRVLYRLLRQLRADRYCLLSTTRYDRRAPSEDQDGPWLEAPYIYIDHGFPWRPISQWPGERRFARGAYTLTNLIVALRRRARRIETAVRSGNYQVIVACSGDPIDLPASAIAARRLGVRFVAYMFDDYGTQYKMLPTYQWFASFFDGFVARRADRVIVPNDLLAAEYSVRHGVRPAVIHNPHSGVYGEHHDRLSSIGEVRIVYTGAVYHVHEDAFARLTEVIEHGNRRFALDLYSSVDTSRNPLFRSDARVRHHSHVADAAAGIVQSEADILFLPLAFASQTPDVVRTALPGKFAEYLASGRPMLVHAPPDSFVAKYCRLHRCAALVDQPNPRMLADGLERVVTDHQFRCSIVRAALQRARADFDPAVAARDFLSVVAGAPGCDEGGR